MRLRLCSTKTSVQQYYNTGTTATGVVVSAQQEYSTRVIILIVEAGIGVSQVKIQFSANHFNIDWHLLVRRNHVTVKWCEGSRSSLLQPRMLKNLDELILGGIAVLFTYYYYYLLTNHPMSVTSVCLSALSECLVRKKVSPAPSDGPSLLGLC